MAGLLPVLLADQPGLALPGQSGRARHARPGPRPDRAGQALVGAAEAVRVAAARAAPRTRWSGSRCSCSSAAASSSSPPGSSTSSSITSSPAPSTRCTSTAPGSSSPPSSCHVPQEPTVIGRCAAAGCCGNCASTPRHTVPEPPDAGDLVSPAPAAADDLPPRRAGLRRGGSLLLLALTVGSVDRRPVAPHRAARAARADHRRRAGRLPDQRDRRRGRHQGRGDRRRAGGSPSLARTPRPARRHA